MSPEAKNDSANLAVNNKLTEEQIAAGFELLNNAVRSLADSRQKSPHVYGNQILASDSQRAGSSLFNDIGKARYTIRCGVITEAISHIQMYRVAFEYAQPQEWCTTLRHVGNILGVTEHSTLSVGTYVAVLWSARSLGYIIGVIPTIDENSAASRSDAIVLGSNVSLMLSDCRNLLQFQPTISNYSFRTPIDSLAVGEFSLSTTTGLLFSIDDFLAQLRVDETTGIIINKFDHLCRIGGQNFQQWTYCGTLDSLIDEAELLWHQGWAIYPWESLGAINFSACANMLKEQTAEECQKTKPYYSRVEPSNDNQTAFHRFQEYRGTLGQGFYRFLCAPPTDDNIFKLDREKSVPGLWQECLTRTGHYGIRSAVGFSFCKQPIIPVPTRVKRAEDPSGDSQKSGNYKTFISSAGPIESGEQYSTTYKMFEHDVAEFHAWLFNWEAAEPFFKHVKDFKFSEESNYVELDIDHNQVTLPWNDIKEYDLMSLGSEHSKTIQIDDRPTNQRIFLNTAFLTCTDDGSIIIGDGYGGTIIMSRGNIEISAAGDILFKSGRDILSYAGGVSVLDSRLGTDLYTNKDIRLRALRNIEIGSGESNSSEPSHLLLQSYCNRGNIDDSEPQGVIIDARKTGFTVGASCIYMTAGRNDYGSGFGSEPKWSTRGEEGWFELEGEIVSRIATHAIDCVSCDVVHKHTDGLLAFFSPEITYIGTQTAVNASMSVRDTLSGGTVLGLSVGKPEKYSGSDYIMQFLAIGGVLTNYSINLCDSGSQGTGGVATPEFSDRNDSACQQYETRWQRFLRDSGADFSEWKFSTDGYPISGHPSDVLSAGSAYADPATYVATDRPYYSVNTTSGELVSYIVPKLNSDS